MALSSLLPSVTFSFSSTLFYTFALVPISLVLLFFYRLFLHSLSSIPGPLAARLSSLYTYILAYTGTEASVLTSLHARYNSPVIRIGPNEVVIADGAALSPIYSEEGGFDKADCYRNFDIDGHASLFSETVRERRQPKAKSVVALFGSAELRKGEGVIKERAERLVERLQAEKARKGQGRQTTNVLTFARALAVDAVSGYLFGRCYGALDEGSVDKESDRTDDTKQGDYKLSAGDFVDTFVAVGRFFYLPNWIFVLLDMGSQYLFETPETVASMSKVDTFVTRVVEATSQNDSTYPGRMLKAGLSRHEVAAQCKDLMFAGTDSSGMNLSTFIWHVVRNPHIYQTLITEIRTARAATTEANSTYDPHNLPYLRACIRETLRLSMANPTRLPRVVPKAGWTFLSKTSRYGERTYRFPAGTVVSCQLHTLHHNPDVFTDPYVFNPSRWIESQRQQSGGGDVIYAGPSMEMSRDTIPFSLGSRQCIARNLAMTELVLGCNAVVESGVLEGARSVGDRIEILEWFNSKVVDERIEIEWT